MRGGSDTMDASTLGDDFERPGEAMHRLLVELFPICRSITGDGVRQTLDVLGREIPLEVHEVPSGTQVFDWTVPDEWNIRDAYVMDESGARVVDFRRNNLHVLGYSEPVDAEMSLEELQPHLHSLEEQPEAIPYLTSYYKRRWGFCLAHRDRERLRPGRYRVRIDSTLEPGSLTYGELRIPGEADDEVFVSTYVCHPSMANNELSGPVVTTMLARWILQQPRRLSYRIVFAPETIGALAYLSRNLDVLRHHVKAAFNMTCVGDERAWSFLPSRRGDTLADRVARHVLAERHPGYRAYSFNTRGSDERQYCSPGADLPMVSIMRSKYGEYPEYHTSLDDPTLVTPAGLEGSFRVIRECLEWLERNRTYRTTCVGEPQLGRRGLYPTLGTRDAGQRARDTLNFLAQADGERDLLAVAAAAELSATDAWSLAERLLDAGLLTSVNGTDGGTTP